VRVFVANDVPVTVIQHVKRFEIRGALSDYRKSRERSRIFEEGGGGDGGYSRMAPLERMGSSSERFFSCAKSSTLRRSCARGMPASGFLMRASMLALRLISEAVMDSSESGIFSSLFDMLPDSDKELGGRLKPGTKGWQG